MATITKEAELNASVEGLGEADRPRGLLGLALDPHRLPDGAGPMGVKLRNAYRVEANGDATKLVCESEFGGEALAAMEGAALERVGSGADGVA